LYDIDSPTVLLTPVVSEQVDESRNWFDADSRDVNRYKTPVWVAPSDMTVMVRARVGGVAGAQAWWDGLKLEESTVATPWGPSAIGATTVDAGGVQIDGTKGGTFRALTSGGAPIELGAGSTGIFFGGDITLARDTSGRLMVDTPAGAPNPRVGIKLPSGHNAASGGWFVWNEGDSVPRSGVGKDTSGRSAVLLGPGGSTAQDVTLHRIAAGVAGIDTDLRVGGHLSVQGVNTPPALTADVNDFDPGPAMHIRVSPSTGVNRTITGLIGPTHVQGTLVVISNYSSTAGGTVTLANESASSIAANRFLCPGNVSYVIPIRGSVMAIYDASSSRWRIISPVA
jgi:hypothetical protein